MNNIGKLFSKVKDLIYTKFGPNPAKMLIVTGVLGWALSSAAQVVAIVVNDKIPKDQKMFLIPQEILDGAINVASFFLVTTTLKNFASKLVSSGKIANTKIRNFLNKQNLIDANGQKLIVGKNLNIEKLPNFSEIADDYKEFKVGTDVIGMTIGSILSCNIITPILRNKLAAKRQNQYLAQTRKTDLTTLPRVSMDAYRNISAAKFGSLKV